eukprot:757018-Hanusia_phi.AAC.6
MGRRGKEGEEKAERKRGGGRGREISEAIKSITKAGKNINLAPRVTPPSLPPNRTCGPQYLPSAFPHEPVPSRCSTLPENEQGTRRGKYSREGWDRRCLAVLNSRSTDSLLSSDVRGATNPELLPPSNSANHFL